MNFTRGRRWLTRSASPSVAFWVTVESITVSAPATRPGPETPPHLLPLTCESRNLSLPFET